MYQFSGALLLSLSSPASSSLSPLPLQIASCSLGACDSCERGASASANAHAVYKLNHCERESACASTERSHSDDEVVAQSARTMNVTLLAQPNKSGANGCARASLKWMDTNTACLSSCMSQVAQVASRECASRN